MLCKESLRGTDLLQGEMMNNPFPTDALDFRKSSYSDRNNCVEVAEFSQGAAVRDTQHRELGHLAFPTPEWHALLGAASRK